MSHISVNWFHSRALNATAGNSVPQTLPKIRRSSERRVFNWCSVEFQRVVLAAGMVRFLPKASSNLGMEKAIKHDFFFYSGENIPGLHDMHVSVCLCGCALCGVIMMIDCSHRAV